MSTQKEKKYIKGFYGKKPNEKAPAFVLGNLSIKVDDAINFLQDNKNDKGYVNIDLLDGKDGKVSYVLNEYKPTPKSGLSDNLPF